MTIERDQAAESPNVVTRRGALRLGLAGSLGLATSSLEASPTPHPPATNSEPEKFLPENDYPFFGYEPDLETNS